jgi:hypothetical protein
MTDFYKRSAVNVLCFMLLVLRRPSTITRAQFWAEDGTVFYRDALLLGWKSLYQPYAGYSHLCPRVVGLLAASFNANSAPLFFNLCALILAALCCGEFTRDRYRGLLNSDILRTTLCVVMAAALPAYEMVGNIANLWSFYIFE